MSIGSIVRATESDFGIVECFQGHSACHIDGACRLKTVLGEALDAFLAVLDRHTLQDLTVRNGPLRNLLTQETP